MEYGEERTGSKGTRLKILTKQVPPKDRQSRQERRPREEDLQNAQKATDGADSTQTGHRRYKSAANGGFADRDQKYAEWLCVVGGKQPGAVLEELIPAGEGRQRK